MILVGSLFSAATSAATPTTALPTLATPTSAGAKQAGWGFTVALADQIGDALEPGVSGDKGTHILNTGTAPDALSGAILHGMSSFITRIVPSPPGPPPNPPSPPPSPPPPPPPSPPSPPPSPPSPPPSCVGLESVSQVALGTCASLSLAPADASSKLLGDDAADALVSSLEESTIGELFLDGNTVGDRGAASLAGLVERSRLSRLSLVDNSVTDAGAYRLADAARWSETLHALDLDGNPIGADGAVYLAEALAYNRALRVLSLRRTAISPLESASASSSASSSAASASSAAASSASSAGGRAGILHAASNQGPMGEGARMTQRLASASSKSPPYSGSRLSVGPCPSSSTNMAYLARVSITLTRRPSLRKPMPRGVDRPWSDRTHESSMISFSRPWMLEAVHRGHLELRADLEAERVDEEPADVPHLPVVWSDDANRPRGEAGRVVGEHLADDEEGEVGRLASVSFAHDEFASTPVAHVVDDVRSEAGSECHYEVR